MTVHSTRTTNDTPRGNVTQHGRRKSHYEKEVEVLERDLLDRRPSHHGTHRQDGAPTVSLSTAYISSIHDEPSPCHSSDVTVAAPDVGQGQAEDDAKTDENAAAVEVDLMNVKQESWQEDGYLFTKEGRTVWVEFAPDSPKDPFQFPQARKWYITIVAIFYTFATSWNTGAYAVGEPSMEVDTGGTPLQAAAGLGVYAWGFAIFPLVLSSGSEEFGRKPLYVVTGILYWLFFFPIAKANNMSLVLVFHFLQGGAGSVGSTMVGGTLADIWVTSERGVKMGMFALCAVLGNSLAPVAMSWVEARSSLQWRWIQWIQIIIFGAFLPFLMVIPETRDGVILRRKAATMRKGMRKLAGKASTNATVDAEYRARSEVDKPRLIDLVKVSLTRPVCKIGTILSFLFNFYQEYLYRKNVATRGPEARLYAAMVGGVCFAVGCFIYAWTSFPDVTYVAPCIGIAIVIFGVFCIYLGVFNFLADSYTVYASSALAGQSFARNMVAGAFPFFTRQLYHNLTPKWGTTLFGCLATLLAIIPFIAFFYGPQIRKRSKFAIALAAEEKRINAEKEVERQARLEKNGQV
ncbi:hypothetical protein QFC22_005047 [Naganishia vaughanmartiniae]|uniref:Uncharacterized protein n=1 Tax=Naganishia vaughanmartiniae TaxID=1424756 RepID=A0ACC2WXQ9_9TREE|nr:hypothetical protein QFC22_005047 [Naganishia vaughanmartiniae]